MRVRQIFQFTYCLALTFLLVGLLSEGPAQATIQGISGISFTLVAAPGYIKTPEGNSIFFWGLGSDVNHVQYPGPTLILNEGDTVTITLYSALPQPVSLVFPGQEQVQAQGGSQGKVTREATPGRPVTYTFVAAHPGTYLYYSGTNMALQHEMGLFGAIIVRPAGFDPNAPTAYGTSDSRYDREYLFMISEMDPDIHRLVEEGRYSEIENADVFPTYYFINGRNAPDTMAPAFAEWLPTQPYNCMPLMHPGERLLMRIIGAGRDNHPYHFHGNHAKVIAEDGRLLSSGPGKGADLGYSRFTISAVPGHTYDAIFQWTGREMGWDYYGHTSLSDPIERGELAVTATLEAPLSAGSAQVTLGGQGEKEFPMYREVRCLIWSKAYPSPDKDPNREVVKVKRASGNLFTISRGLEGTTARAWSEGDYVAITDHGRPFPVVLPENQNLTFGAFYSGSPYLGNAGNLPPGEGGLNPFSGFFYMWHSHNEKELLNNNIFPGGAMTMLGILPYNAPIE